MPATGVLAPSAQRRVALQHARALLVTVDGRLERVGGGVQVHVGGGGRGVAEQVAQRGELGAGPGHVERPVGVAQHVRMTECRRDACGGHQRPDDVGQGVARQGAARVGKGAVAARPAQAGQQERLGGELGRAGPFPVQQRVGDGGGDRQPADLAALAVYAQPRPGAVCVAGVDVVAAQPAQLLGAQPHLAQDQDHRQVARRRNRRSALVRRRHEPGPGQPSHPLPRRLVERLARPGVVAQRRRLDDQDLRRVDHPQLVQPARQPIQGGALLLDRPGCTAGVLEEVQVGGQGVCGERLGGRRRGADVIAQPDREALID